MSMGIGTFGRVVMGMVMVVWIWGYVFGGIGRGSGWAMDIDGRWASGYVYLASGCMVSYPLVSGCSYPWLLGAYRAWLVGVHIPSCSSCSSIIPQKWLRMGLLA